MTPGTPTPGTCSRASPRFSLLTKYVIRYRGSHVFNPSNIGLVVAFVVLGSSRVEPLDFWWAPLNVWMIAAYAVIIGGGLLITRRLRLLALAATFWVALAVGTGILAGSGHCMTTNWAFAPVCGFDFWRVIVTSPEVLIFLFFMITDPKTVPAGRVGRVVFGLLVAVGEHAPDGAADQRVRHQGRAARRPGRRVRGSPAPRPAASRTAIGGGRASAGSRPDSRPAATPAPGSSAAAVRVGLAVAAVLVLGVGIVAAGTPARGLVVPDTAEMLDGVPHEVDPATFPAITVGQDVADWDHTIAGPGAQADPRDARREPRAREPGPPARDGSILTAVDHGDRLKEMQGRLQDASDDGQDRHRSLPVRRGARVAASCPSGSRPA